ncbi:MAG: hypothetical protein R3A78_15825 [Polyangiales bacterium]|nr:hypothetical protein [Myxococcales bacterium]
MASFRPRVSVVAWAMVCTSALVACDGSPSSDDADGSTTLPDGKVLPPAPKTGETLTHEFPAFVAAPGEEIPWECQSWTLHNDKPLYVTSVSQENDGAWHHSNWFFVPEDTFDGPDGTWSCSSREFNEVAAGLAGGVLFAQSTQSLTDEQAFHEGKAIELPAHARIVGNAHILNATAKSIETAIRFTIKTARAEDVDTKLYPVSYTNIALDLEPNAESRFVMTCNIGDAFERKFNRAPDFHIEYVLPHYHALGNYFRIEALGGDKGDRVVFETKATVGDPVGKTLDPAFDMAGATDLRITCGYDNPRSSRVGYGIGDQEMCVFLAYIDAPIKIAGTAIMNEPLGPNDDGIFMNNSPCGGISF